MVDEAAAATISILEATGAATVAAGNNIVVLTGAIFASTALAEAAIENNGGFELTLTGANTANDDLIVVWSDGSNLTLVLITSPVRLPTPWRVT